MHRIHVRVAENVVFNAFPQAEYGPDVYDEVLTLEETTASPTMPAYEMNWNSLPVPHVTPFLFTWKSKPSTGW